MKFLNIDFSNLSLSRSELIQLHRSVIYLDNYQELDMGISMLLHEDNPQYELLFLESSFSNSILTQLTQSSDLYYFSCDENFQNLSSGILYTPKRKGENWVKLHFNYLLIYKVEHLYYRKIVKSEHENLARFVAKDLSRLYDQIMLSKMVKGESDRNLNHWWMNRY
ncbi:hypothetical protein LH29_01850 [Draconibacterium sediminis]|uniref:Uncharacterized protein n=1 Tax=Draconibacterium sediminis TaxID=1544798 RepID=A0A0D8JBL0_9BACT|nr:hypothetical protein LH29_01850 [Draconibacterium sediminis]